MMRLLSFAALAAALVVGPVGCKKKPPTEARIDAALAPLIPADSTVVACLRLDRIRETPLWEKYVASRRVTALEDFRARTGLDPLKDIWELVAVSNGRNQIVLIRGKFGGQFGLEPRLEMEGAQRMNYKSYNIVHRDGAGVMFLNTGAAVAGRIGDLKRIVDGRDDPNEKPPARLLELVKKAPGGSHFWAVTTSGASLASGLPQDGPAANAVKVAASLGEGWLWMDLNDGIRMHAEGAYPNGESARQINDALRGLVGIARLRTPDSQPELLQVYDGFNVRARNEVVEIDFTAPANLIDQIVKLFGVPLAAKG